MIGLFHKTKHPNEWKIKLGGTAHFLIIAVLRK